ncbi:MAG: 4Fe-4S binding protein [Desulfomonile tiedjei]|uniref:4Fe-4S binding protein n=1 Tax=Desulfomonile tiedjei TaxID=2358 RepID=A0A9D6UZ92_9BACT|nr:4Fe-4S binding protein [Desulfomonile tiedjei]
MKVKRNIIEIDEELCDGCGQCITTCAEGALEIVDGKAKLVSERYCDGLGACLSGCPTGALKVIQRDADDFDEEAVHEHLEELKQEEAPQEKTLACGCPSATLQTFNRPVYSQMPEEHHSQASSALRHWPVQIRLVPPTAPFLRNADLLVAADCTPIAYPAFHRDFLEGKAVMIGCPKFDDAQSYVEKFAQIFHANTIKSVTVVVMEVPCCSGLPLIVKRAMELAGKTVPMEQVVISASGDILKKQKLVA